MIIDPEKIHYIYFREFDTVTIYYINYIGMFNYIVKFYPHPPNTDRYFVDEYGFLPFILNKSRLFSWQEYEQHSKIYSLEEYYNLISMDS